MDYPTPTEALYLLGQSVHPRVLVPGDYIMTSHNHRFFLAVVTEVVHNWKGYQVHYGKIAKGSTVRGSTKRSWFKSVKYIQDADAIRYVNTYINRE